MFFNKKLLNFSLLLLLMVGSIFTIASLLIPNISELKSSKNVNSSNTIEVYLYASQITDDKATINWEITNNDANIIDSILVKNNETNEEIYSNYTIDIQDLNSSSEMNNLNANTSYNVKIEVNWTNENGKSFIDMDQINFSTLETNHINPQLSVYADNITLTSTTLNWEITNSKDFSIDILSIVNLDDVSLELILFNEDIQTISSHVLSNLEPNHTYRFEVFISWINPFSQTPYTDKIIEFSTLSEYGIPPKYNLEQTNVTETSVEIKWNIENLLENDISKIGIIDEENNLIYEDSEIKNSDLNSSTIVENLSSNTIYNWKFIVVYQDLEAKEQFYQQEITFKTNSIDDDVYLIVKILLIILILMMISLLLTITISFKTKKKFTLILKK